VLTRISPSSSTRINSERPTPSVETSLVTPPQGKFCHIMSDANKDYSVPTGILQLIAAQTMSEVASRDPRYQSIANTLTQSIDITELLNAPSMQRGLRPQAKGMLSYLINVFVLYQNIISPFVLHYSTLFNL